MFRNALQWHSVPGGTTPVSPLGQDQVERVLHVRVPVRQGGPGGEGATAEQSSVRASRGMGEAVARERTDRRNGRRVMVI